MPTPITRRILDDLFDSEGSDLIRDADWIGSRGDVLAKARLVAACLNGCGLEPGERVAILCTSASEEIIGFLAVLMTPFCAVPVHSASPPAAVGHVLADSGARAIVIDRPKADLESRLAGLELVDMSIMPQGVEMAARRSPPNADDIAALLYTSGTTGVPKAVQISFGNLESMTEQLVNDFFRVDQSDTLLMVAPLSNIYGVSVVMVALRARATLSIPGNLRPNNLMDTLIRDRVSFLAGVPMLASLILSAAKTLEDPLPHLRRVLLAGTRLDPALAKEFACKFSAEVMTGYAMTEAVPVAMALDLATTQEGSVGTIAREIQLRIVDSEMNQLEVGQVGEILIKGAPVTTGYWRASEANAHAFHNGWFRTGDIGKLDENGHLELIDRVKDIIKTAGNTIFPSEVEKTLKEHPGIQDAAVVGMPHKILGEVVVAYFTSREGHLIDPAELQAYCANRLTKWKVPRKFTSVEAMPVTPSGKISRHRLRVDEVRQA